MPACLHCGRELSPRGLFFVGAILAIVFGKMAEKRIAENPALDGAGLARAGIIIGWVGFGVILLMILFGFAVLGAFSSAGRDLPVRLGPTPS